MSLINEALKKAQRQRHEELAAPTPATNPGEPAAAVRIPRRGKATAANTLVLIGSGAIVLIVLSVVGTIYLVNRPAAPAPRVASAPTPAPTVPATPGGADTSTPAIVAPAIPAPAASAPTNSGAATSVPAASPSPAVTSAPAGPTPVAAAPISAPPATVPASIDPAPTPGATPGIAETPPQKEPAATPATSAAPRAPDERVAAFVEAIRVTGIRSSGTESRVLMNERVYRVNDIVDRALGVRLIKVASDSLTFSDANGITYEKHF